MSVRSFETGSPNQKIIPLGKIGTDKRMIYVEMQPNKLIQQRGNKTKLLCLLILLLAAHK